MMGCAVSIDASVNDMEFLCRAHRFGVSTIERLASGGARLVLFDPRDAECIRLLMKGKVMEGAIAPPSGQATRRPVSWR